MSELSKYNDHEGTKSILSQSLQVNKKCYDFVSFPEQPLTIETYWIAVTKH